MIPPGFEAPRGRAGAFCGLGNPASFRRTLAQLGVRLEFFEVFPDHHAYTVEEVERMAGRADVLLTTEKDWLNLPDPSRATPVRIRLQIENSDELLKMLEARLPTPAAGA